MQIIGIIGAGTCSPQTAQLAETVGYGLAQQHLALICGGLGGVMAAACRGAKDAGGTTIGILPGTNRAAANPWVDFAIATGLGEARNLMIVRSAQALIAVGGEYGTLSEIAFALKLGVPIIGLETWQLARQGQILNVIPEAETAEAAVAWVLQALLRRDGCKGRRQRAGGEPGDFCAKPDRCCRGRSSNLTGRGFRLIRPWDGRLLLKKLILLLEEYFRQFQRAVFSTEIVWVRLRNLATPRSNPFRLLKDICEGRNPCQNCFRPSWKVMRE